MDLISVTNMSSGSHLPLCIDSVCAGSWTDECWQPVCGERMDDVLHTENLPQHFSRSVLRSVGTRQNRTDHCLLTHTYTHTHQVPSPLVEHKMHINNAHTSINTLSIHSSAVPALCLCSAHGSCAQLCLFVLSFCCLSCFARRHSTRSLGVWCFFSPSGRLLRCLYWMFCTALNVFLHPYSCLTLSQAPPHLI